MPSLIVYVDGFNLYHGLKDQFGRRMLWLDLVARSNRLRPRSSLMRVRSFTAPVLGDPPAASRQGGTNMPCSPRIPVSLTSCKAGTASRSTQRSLARLSRTSTWLL